MSTTHAKYRRWAKRLRVFAQPVSPCGRLRDLNGAPCTLHRLTPCCRLRRNRALPKRDKSCEEVFGRLISEGVSKEDLYTAVVNQTVEIVLTAHPTQVDSPSTAPSTCTLPRLLNQNPIPPSKGQSPDLAV